MAFMTSDRMRNDAHRWAVARRLELRAEIAALDNLFPDLADEGAQALTPSPAAMPLEMAHDGPGDEIDEEMGDYQPARPRRIPGTTGGWSQAQRNKVSLRMKKYWAARKREQRRKAS